MKARRRTLASAIRLAVLLALPATVMAQEATTLDTLTVTGSRIKRAEMEGRVPVQTLFFPDDHQPPLAHEYQFNLDTEAGQQALDESVSFLRGLGPGRAGAMTAPIE